MSTLPALLEGTAIQEQVRSLHAIRLWVRGVGAYEASEAALRLAKAMEAQGVEHVFGDRCGR